MMETGNHRVQSADVCLRRPQAARICRLVGLALCVAAAVFPCYAQVTTTEVQDTVYNADGTFAAGTILVSWPAFVTAKGNTVAAGNLATQIGANG